MKIGLKRKLKNASWWIMKLDRATANFRNCKGLLFWIFAIGVVYADIVGIILLISR